MIEFDVVFIITPLNEGTAYTLNTVVLADTTASAINQGMAVMEAQMGTYSVPCLIEYHDMEVIS